MYAYLIGKVMEISEDNLVLEVNNIGYNLKISTQTSSLLPRNEEVKLYTYTCVREDAFSLYGFITKQDLEMFKLIITVNGIGPKGGLAILATMTTDDLRYAILSSDAKAISKAPGIGAKTAERLILELKDKINIHDVLSNAIDRVNESIPIPVQDSNQNNAKQEALEALVALGYSASEALKVTNKITISSDMDTESILKAALKNISNF